MGLKPQSLGQSLSKMLFGLAMSLSCFHFANAFPGPYSAEPTPYEADPFKVILGWSAVPTAAPDYEPHIDLIKRGLHGIDRRQISLSSGQLIGYYGVDNTCGYISGTLGASLTCSPLSRCAAIAPIGNNDGAMGCCPNAGTGCYWITTCLDAEAISSGKCDAACSQDDNVRRCTEPSLPYCSGLSWPDIKATIWGCGAEKQSSLDLVSTTFVGETDKHAYLPQYYTPTKDSDNSALFPTADLPTRTASGSSGASSSASATNSASDNGGGNKTPTGAIVGGVVGGLAVLGATGLGVFYLMMRKRRAKKEGENDATDAPAHDPNAGPRSSQPAEGAAASYYAGAGETKGAEQQQYPGQFGPGLAVPGNEQTYMGDNRASTMSDATMVPPYPSPGFAGGQMMHQQQQSGPVELSSEEKPREIYEAPGS